VWDVSAQPTSGRSHRHGDELTRPRSGTRRDSQQPACAAPRQSPIRTPAPPPAGERDDAGVLLSVLLDGRKGNSLLLALDAGSLRELARAEVPHHIPFGFHGQFARGLTF